MSSPLSALGRRTAPPAISWLMGLTLAHPKLISLAAGFTDNASLPVDEARALLDEILSAPRTGRPALQYGSTAGDPLLRELTARRLAELDKRTLVAAVCDRRLAVDATASRRSQTAATEFSPARTARSSCFICSPRRCAIRATSCSSRTRLTSSISASRKATGCAAGACACCLMELTSRTWSKCSTNSAARASCRA